MENVSSAALRRRRQQLVRALPPLEQIIRGSLIETYKRCGRSSCHCNNGPGHGPTRYLSTVARCQSASNRDPRFASKRDPFERRVRPVAFAPSELVGVAETARARVVW